MDRGGEFHDAEAGAEMAARDRNGVDGLLPQLVGNLPDLIDFQPAQIVRRLDSVEEGSFAECGHGIFQFFGAEPRFRREMVFSGFGPSASQNRPGLVARADARFQSVKVFPIDQCDVSHFAAWTRLSHFSLPLQALNTVEIRPLVACKSAYSPKHYTKADAKANPREPAGRDREVKPVNRCVGPIVPVRLARRHCSVR
jgi:hypothetical protein